MKNPTLTSNTLHLRDSRFFDIIECHVPTIQANWMFPDGKVVYRLSTWVTFWIYFWLHYATTYIVHICDMWASVSRFSINYSWTATIHECIFLFRFFACIWLFPSFNFSIFHSLLDNTLIAQSRPKRLKTQTNNVLQFIGL